MELALVSVMVGMGAALISIVFAILADLAGHAHRRLRRLGRPGCVVCGKRALRDEPEFCRNHVHLKPLRRRERSVVH
jgi:hypothetical protein